MVSQALIHGVPTLNRWTPPPPLRSPKVGGSRSSPEQCPRTAPGTVTAHLCPSEGGRGQWKKMVRWREATGIFRILFYPPSVFFCGNPRTSSNCHSEFFFHPDWNLMETQGVQNWKEHFPCWKAVAPGPAELARQPLLHCHRPGIRC